MPEGACNFDAGCGTIFKISPAGKLTTLHNFEGGDGANPTSTLILATDGRFYGTAGSYGNPPYVGTAFAITSQGEFATLHNFTSAEGYPNGVIQGNDGSFYGNHIRGRNWRGFGVPDDV